VEKFENDKQNADPLGRRGARTLAGKILAKRPHNSRENAIAQLSNLDKVKKIKLLSRGKKFAPSKKKASEGTSPKTQNHFNHFVQEDSLSCIILGGTYKT
jgi:hypothetical protein